jgi:hypothetical protein
MKVIKNLSSSSGTNHAESSNCSLDAIDHRMPITEATGNTVLLLYIATMFLSATLLFLVQPMFAKMILPLFGGSPAVWTTTAVVYQVILLAGYLYAHLAVQWLGVRRQALFHLLLLCIPVAVLPIAVPAEWNVASQDAPILELVAVMAVAVGLPFFAVSTMSPLLQTWFSRTGHHAAGDPYFLYAASNVGSLIGLISYPILEVYTGTKMHSIIWTVGYVVMVVLTLLCAFIIWSMIRRQVERPQAESIRAEASQIESSDGMTLGRRIYWIILAFIPSSLMLSITLWLSTTIAPIPLIWVVPLALYLLTFILAFGSRSFIPYRVAMQVMILMLPLVTFSIVARASEPLWPILTAHLVLFFLAALVCHKMLASDRPSTSHLTEFYVWLSVGGALGGLFNAIVAPYVFISVLEYPIVLVIMCLVMSLRGNQPNCFSWNWLDIALPLTIGAITIISMALFRVGGAAGQVYLLLTLCVPTIACYLFTRRPARLAAGLTVFILVGGVIYPLVAQRELYADRSFFGIHRVLTDPNGEFHLLVHGNTIHGVQSLEPARRREPLTYYTPSGPVGQLFARLGAAPAGREVAIVGLGTGSLACYSKPADRWTFYEIDSSIVETAQNPRFFTYLRDCAPSAGIVVGDARLTLAAAPPDHYDLIVLDAFTSDAPPTHLLTREALALYLQHLAPDGILAFHISNRYLDLKPLMSALAADAGLVGLSQDDVDITNQEIGRGKSMSRWVVLARSDNNLAGLADDPRWQRLTQARTPRVWTDDFSSILGLLLGR